MPIVKAANEVRVKERTYITLIDYGRLAEESWPSASIRPKLQRILFLFYEWAPEVDIDYFKIDGVELWSPTSSDLTFFEVDWAVVQAKVRAGEAHHISEGDGRALGAATKGASSLQVRKQPFSPILAKQRGWALKPPFVRSVYLEACPNVRPVESLIATLRLDPRADFESRVRDHFARYVGMTVGGAGNLLGVPPTGAKHASALVIRRALGQRDPAGRIAEFERLGIEIKIVRLGPDARPYEAMSFPAFRYREFIAESWEDSDLLARLNRLLIVPLEGRSKHTPADECIIRSPFLWSPAPDELEGIHQEWEMFRAEVAAGHAATLTTARNTTYIHVRPKARDSRDTDESPVVGPVVKKCFWLNQPFIQRLVLQYALDWERGPKE